MGEAAITFSAQTIAFYERKNIASFNKIRIMKPSIQYYHYLLYVAVRKIILKGMNIPFKQTMP